MKKKSDKSGVLSLLPKEIANILSNIKNFSGKDILRQNILLQYAAIIRAQQLIEDEYERKKPVQEQFELPDCPNGAAQKTMDWETYKPFLDVQSKAMNSLTSMLKKLDEYADATEEIQNGTDNPTLAEINVICNLPDKSSGKQEEGNSPQKGL